MNKDKIIKDLKERNDKLSNQYRLRDIRCITLEYRIDKAKEWIYIVQQNKDNKHLEPVISTNELYDLLSILGGKE